MASDYKVINVTTGFVMYKVEAGAWKNATLGSSIPNGAQVKTSNGSAVLLNSSNGQRTLMPANSQMILGGSTAPVTSPLASSGSVRGKAVIAPVSVLAQTARQVATAAKKT